MLAVCFFPFDVFIRRVIVGWSDAVTLARAIFPSVRKKIDPVLSALKQEREAIQLRSAWDSVGGAAVVAEGSTAGTPPEEEPEETPATKDAPVVDKGRLGRLMEAKKRAKRKMDGQ